MGVRSSIESLRFQLPFNLKVDSSGCPVLGNFLAVKHHPEFRDARPLHAAHGFRGFGNGILGVSFAKILFALKIARFPVATAVPSRLSLHPRAPRFSPEETPVRCTCIYKDI